MYFYLNTVFNKVKRLCMGFVDFFLFCTSKPITNTMRQDTLLKKEFISVNELMEIFDISRATAQRLLKSGEIHSAKLGGKVIIPTKPLREKFV